MARSSFTVSFRKMGAERRIVILGVTSIVPNLDGLLLFTEDHENYQVESHEMRKRFKDDSPDLLLRVEYSDDWDIQMYLELGAFDIIDHREKES